jgi:hypothetical protein
MVELIKQIAIWDPRDENFSTTHGRLFQQKILPELPVETLSSHYHEWNG